MRLTAIPRGFRRIRRDRQIQEVVHDSYRSRGKPGEPTACPDCGAVFHRGRWQKPLQRIMEIAPAAGGLAVTTTDPHLARALGEAVHRAYRGRLEFHYNRGENLLRVHWAR